MSFTHPGNAGGQPRLTLPFMSLSPDDPLFASKYQANMRTLLTWANSLLNASASPLLGWWYGNASITNSVNPVTWTQVLTGSFAYWNGGLTEIVALPTNSITQILYGFSQGTARTPGSDNPFLYLQLLNGTGALQVGPPAAWQDRIVGTTPGSWWQTPVMFFMTDSASLPTALPWKFEAEADNVGAQVAYCSILSWSKS